MVRRAQRHSEWYSFFRYVYRSTIRVEHDYVPRQRVGWCTSSAGAAAVDIQLRLLKNTPYPCDCDRNTSFPSPAFLEGTSSPNPSPDSWAGAPRCTRASRMD